MQSFYSTLLVLPSFFLCTFTNPRNEKTLESGEVCSLNSDPARIELGYGLSSSFVVLSEDYFARWKGRYQYKCKFTVKAKDRRINDGIYAVFQNLDFRMNLTTGECIDYVQLSAPPADYTRFFGTKSSKNVKRFCGELSPRKAFLFGEYSESAIGDNAYVAIGNEVNVEIFIAKESALSHEQPRVTLAFTAFKRECYKDAKGLRQCKIGECIWEDLFNDRIQNCPYISCADENDMCQNFNMNPGSNNPDYPEIYYKAGGHSGVELTAGAIASTILMFLLFAGCLCVCKKSQRFCWAPRPARLPPPVQQAEQGQMVLPSAPLEEEIKDAPPPSYDSIFGTPLNDTTNSPSIEPMAESRT